MAGYSGTPLAKKLGIKENFRVALVGAPRNFREELGPLPSGASFVPQTSGSLGLILLFVKSRSELTERFAKLAAKLAPDGMLWVAWPKKSSGVAADLSFGAVQEVGLAAGLVDNKVCAINEVWSGLRFVIRVKDRLERSR